MSELNIFRYLKYVGLCFAMLFLSGCSSLWNSNTEVVQPAGQMVNGMAVRHPKTGQRFPASVFMVPHELMPRSK